MDEVLKIKRETATAILPTRGSDGAVGYDCYADLEEYTKGRGMVITAGRRGVISLGFSMQPPSGCYGRIAPRSGLALRHGIDTLAGVIDADYTGIVTVIILNTSETDFRIKDGDRVCQLILEQAKIVPIVEVKDLNATQRGQNGFGSTGISLSL